MSKHDNVIGYIEYLDSSGCVQERIASVDKGIHNKTTKYGLPTY